MDDDKIKKSACQKLLDLLRRAQLQKVIGSYDGNIGSGVVYETGRNGVCKYMELKSKDSWKKTWRPIDSNVTNARKCLEVEQYES